MERCIPRTLALLVSFLWQQIPGPMMTTCFVTTATLAPPEKAALAAHAVVAIASFVMMENYARMMLVMGNRAVFLFRTVRLVMMAIPALWGMPARTVLV